MYKLADVSTRGLLLAGACLALLPQDGHAQTAERTADQPANPPRSSIGEIVVTAEKRETRLQKTPVAITAIPAERLEAQNITGVQQLQYNVPSLVFAQQTGYAFVTLRGLGSDLISIAGEPSVATYRDNVYTGINLTQSLPSFDLQRIEVLRGPQGTLYGRNATGGVINYISKLPSFESEMNLSGTIGTYGRHEVEGGVTGPIVDDKVAYRFSFSAGEHDGYIRNLFLRKREDARRNWGAAGSLLVKATPDLDIVLRGDYVEQRSSPPLMIISQVVRNTFGPLDQLISPQLPLGVFSQPASYFAANPGILSPADIQRLNGRSIGQFLGLSTQPGPARPDYRTRRIVNRIPTSYTVKSGGLSGTADWDLGGASLRSITAYRYAELTYLQESHGTPSPFLISYPDRVKTKQWTQEFNLTGNSFSDKLDWLLGAFYYDTRSSDYSTLFKPANGEYNRTYTSLVTPGGPFMFDLSRPVASYIPANPTVLNTLLTDTPDPFGNGFYNAGDPTSIPPYGFLAFADDQKSRSIAGFGQATYHVTDRWRVTGGIRYTADRKEVVRSFHSNFLPAVALCDQRPESKSWHAWTGSIGTDYDLAQRTLVYAKYSTGYKAGGFNQASCLGSFDPEHIKSYEAGLKSVFANGQVSANAAGFYYKYDDIQFTTYLGNASAVLNASSAELYGLELELQAAPSALPGFSVDGSASWIHSEYTGGNPFSPDGLFTDGTGLARIDIRGNELVRSPKYKVSGGAQYELPVGALSTLTLRGEASWTDTIYNDIFNGAAPLQEATTQPSYWLVNARLGWDFDHGRYRVQLFGENLTNTLYTNARASFASAPFVTVGGNLAAPRTFGLRVSIKR